MTFLEHKIASAILYLMDLCDQLGVDYYKCRTAALERYIERPR